MFGLFSVRLSLPAILLLSPALYTTALGGGTRDVTRSRLNQFYLLPPLQPMTHLEGGLGFLGLGSQGHIQPKCPRPIPAVLESTPVGFSVSF